MNSKVYKWCAVPQCKNTSITTPNKVFVHVPNKKLIRDKWLKLSRRNPNDVVTNSPLYFCEDHFDMPNDMENYMEYHVMGSVSQVRMKPGCMPKNFICQPDRNTRTSDTTERPYIAKKQRMMILEVCKKQLKKKSKVTEQSSSEQIASGGAGGSLPHDDAGSCDSCHSTITGIRHICVQCEYSHCAACEAAGRHDHHYMLRVPRQHQQEAVQRIVKMIQMELADVVSYEKPPDPNEEQPIIKTEIKTEVPDPLAEDTPSTEKLRPDILEQAMLEIDIKQECDSDEVVDPPPPLQMPAISSLPVTCPAPAPGGTSTSKRRSLSELQTSAAKKSFITIHAGNISGVGTVKTEPLAEEESLQTHEEASGSGAAGVTIYEAEPSPMQKSTGRKKEGRAPKKKQ